MSASIQDRLRGGLGAAIMVGLLGYLLLVGLPVARSVRGEPLLTPLNLLPPVPTAQPRKPDVARPERRRASRHTSSPTRKDKATEIITPAPVLPRLMPSPVVVALKAGPGRAVSTGAADRAGAGEGAGSAGDGTGGGGDGDGDGDGGGDVPPHLIRGHLSFSDLPRGLREGGIGGVVSVQYTVDVDGRAGDCVVTASSGSTDLDDATCRSIERRFRFDPSRDRSGVAVPSMVDESHRWDFEHGVDPAPDG